MKLKEYLDQNRIFVDLKPADKLTLLEMLVDKVTEQIPEVDSKILLKRLLEREEKVSTGIGLGIAVPHATVEGLEETVCLMAQIPEGVEFDSIDQKKVHFVFLILSSPAKIGNHIKLLARIARMVCREKFIRDVSNAPDAGTIFDLVVKEDERHVT